MPEGRLTIVREDSPEIVNVRKRGDSISADLRDMAEAKPSLLTMREGAKLLDAVNAYITFVHGALDPGISEAYAVWKQRTALRSTLLRLPLDNAFPSTLQRSHRSWRHREAANPHPEEGYRRQQSSSSSRRRPRSAG